MTLSKATALANSNKFFDQLIHCLQSSDENQFFLLLKSQISTIDAKEDAEQLLKILIAAQQRFSPLAEQTIHKIYYHA